MAKASNLWDAQEPLCRVYLRGDPKDIALFGLIIAEHALPLVIIRYPEEHAMVFDVSKRDYTSIKEKAWKHHLHSKFMDPDKPLQRIPTAVPWHPSMFAFSVQGNCPAYRCKLKAEGPLYRILGDLDLANWLASRLVVHTIQGIDVTIIYVYLDRKTASRLRARGYLCTPVSGIPHEAQIYSQAYEEHQAYEQAA